MICSRKSASAVQAFYRRGGRAGSRIAPWLGTRPGAPLETPGRDKDHGQAAQWYGFIRYRESPPPLVTHEEFTVLGMISRPTKIDGT